jgi:hypothetical protein
VAAVTADYQTGANFERAIGCARLDSGGRIALTKKADGLVLHEQMEAGKPSGTVREEVEKVPLRHERDELAMGGKVAEIGGPKFEVSYYGAHRGELLVRDFQEIFEESEFAQEFERGGMDSVAAEVAEKVLVFLEYGDVDTRASEEIAQHHASGATPDYATSCLE